MNTGSLSRIVPTKVLIGLLAGLPLTLFFLWVTAEGSAVPAKPHSVPVAVVGPGPVVARVAGILQRGHAFRVIYSSTEATAVDLVADRKADAVVELGTGQLLTAQASSPVTASALPQILSGPGSRLQLATTDIKPFTPGDPTGMGLMFIALACVLGGLPAGIAMAFLSRARRPVSLADASGRVVLVILFSGIMALFIALLADGILGYGGDRMLTIWAWGAMLCAASMAVPAALVGAIGLPGVLVSAVPVLFFGVPSSPIPVSWDWESSVFRTLGPLDPFGATVDGIRNGIFFGDASQARDLAVLSVWAVVPVLVLLGLGLIRKGVGPEAPAHSATAGQLPSTQRSAPRKATVSAGALGSGATRSLRLTSTSGEE